jgi:hypothetical protein
MPTNENDVVIDDAYISVLEKDLEWAKRGAVAARDAHFEAEIIHAAADHLMTLLSKGGFESEASVVAYLIANFAGVRDAREKKFIRERDVLNDWHSELVEVRRKRAASTSEAASANN